MRVLRAVVATFVLASTGVVAVAVSTTPAGAQTCTPGVYGCPTTTTSTPAAQTTCTTDAQVVASGEVHNVFVIDAPANADVDITFDGSTVASGNASASGDATIGYTVPDGLDGGAHPVFAVGAGFSADCGSVSSAQDLGESLTKSQSGADRGRGSVEVLGRPVARASVEVGALVALGLVLGLVFGARPLRRLPTDRGRRNIAQ